MSPRDLRLCRVIGSFALAAVLAAAAVVGANAFVAAKRGDLFPPMHLVER